MATDNRAVNSEEGDDPSVRQLLHAATGDREAEAKALAARSEDDVSEEEAKRAVELAHRDVRGNTQPEHDIASPEDAKAVSEEESSSDS